jgi:hypothetical protein
MDPTADSIFITVPAADMPPGRPAVYLEVGDQPRWLIREGEASPELVAELNQLATHLIRHGLWEKHRERGQQPPRMRRAS